MPALRLALIAAAIVLPVQLAEAQLETSWTSALTPASSFDARGTQVAIDAAGMIHVVGYIDEVSSATLVIAKLDAAGATQWNTTIPGLPRPLAPRAIAISSGGRAAIAGIAGSSSGLSSQSGSTLLVSIDPAGQVEWVRIGSVSQGSSLEDVAFDAAGNVYACGANGTIGVVRKLDPQGTQQWEAATLNASRFQSMEVLPNGEVFTVALRLGTGAFVTKLDGATGGSQWLTEINPAAHTTCWYQIALDPNASAYVSGLLESGGATEFGLARFDPQGVLQWKSLVPPLTCHDDFRLPIAFDPSGRIILSGRNYLSGSDREFQTAAFAASGNLEWFQSLGTPNSLLPSSAIATDALGAIYGVGNELSSGTAPTSGIVGVFDASGEQRFSWNTYAANPSSYLKFIQAVATHPNGSILIAGATAGDHRITVKSLRRTSTAFCFGDGSGTACPCANQSQPTQNAGCVNSLGSGARLVDAGASSLGDDTFVLEGSGMPNGAALYFQGTLRTAGGSGAIFGDGLRCAGGTIVRLGVEMNAGGASRHPGVGDLPISVRGSISAPSTVRTYQVWYRNSASFCTSAPWNLTNGVEVTWTN